MQAIKVPEVTTFQRSYLGEISRVRRVRADLAPFVGEYPLADELIMVASELAANAALHSNSGKPGGEFTVRAQLYHGDYAWLEVEDRGGRWNTCENGDGHPHGLDIVARLAGPENWGIEETSSGNRVVWVRLAWTAE
jgi:two-component sensor histidine kinase